ncbi:phosphatidylserine decarboxylase [Mesobacillus maritimus]|uniref:phosphatidylserine decarboxylase n=1 Tax=Mesobacillus maritimus TaxID=1643336 RepID=UPI00384FF74C
MIQSLYRLFIELTNRKWSSTLIRGFARSRVSKRVVPSFAKIYSINQEEMEKELQDYTTLHDFFIRRLKPGVRPIAEQSDVVVSPVDAVIEDIGLIEPNHEIIVKGKVYSIAEMLGSREAAEHYQEGKYMVLYLSPSHYHRIHSPVTGTVLKQWTLGTRSYPVNRLGLKYGKATLAKNFRTITEIGYENRRLAVVKVGAMFVNSIEPVHKGDELHKGQEIAYFSFGSTVVLLFEKDALNLAEKINLPKPIKVGESLGTLNR